jgi:hypothetical protein
MTAAKILRTSADTIEARGRLRDSGQERSMARTVAAFNAVTGQRLTETEGWIFMAVLKLARESSGHDPDNFVDGAAYMALAGEAADAPPRPEIDDAPACPAVRPVPRVSGDGGGIYRDIPRTACPSCEDD